MRIQCLLAVACSLLSLAATNAQAPADVIYHGGPIVTVDDRSPSAEALAVKDGKIVAVGNKADVLRHRGASTRVVDLGGKTMVPGFLDGHSHFINCLQVAQQANCFAPPAGPGKSVASIIEAMKAHQKKFNIPKGEFIIGYGYDGNEMEEKREMTAADLDAAFPDHPVFVGHVSLHGAVCNSLALKKFNVTKDTPTPKGGVIVRKPGTMEPEGLLMEAAWMPIFANMPKPGEEELLRRFQEGQMIYAAAGVTTAQEGATVAPDVAILRKAADKGLLFIDVAAYPFITEAKAVFQDNPPETFGTYKNRLKLAGIKVTCDGSPQGRTAYFTKPYLTGGPGGEKDWKGEPLFPQSDLDQMVKSVYDKNLQLIVHCNGDASIDMFLAAHEKAAQDRFADRRTTIIHSQFVRRDQLDKYAAYKLMPSYYTEHCFYFGDTHIRNRGQEQAAFISPMNSSLKKGIRCQNHTDFNVAPIDQLFVMWSAVNRLTRTGEVLGPDERVTPLQALKAITLDCAYMYREEQTKGSLEVGKLADLVVLDKNPLTVDPKTIKDIKVVETIKEGKTIYSAK
ncbi:MAG: amidohydrolase [Gemmataceae bacterium]|nr:amidohydrolase [Gemmataceae bacterium]